MADWKLELTEDILRKKHPVFSALEDRITEYEQFYFNSATQKRTLSRENLSGQNALFNASPDVRGVPSPFSTLLCLYDGKGGEYTFSRSGMRHMQRRLPWQGHYHTHDCIEILSVLKGSFSQILLGEHQAFSAGDFVITDKNLEHADVLEGPEPAAVLFLSLRSAYLDQLLSSYDHQDDLQRFLFHALRRQRKEQSYIHLQPANFSLTLPKGPVHPGTYDGFPNRLSEIQKTPEDLPEQFPGISKSPISLSSQLSRIQETLIEEDYFPGEGSQEIIRGNLIRLLSLLCREFSIKLHSSDHESREKAMLYELERYIRIHFATVTARELEEVFHYHRNYYNLILQKYRGVSFQEYTQSIRLQHAASLLRSTGLSVKEAALAAGYHNSSHFYHLFEKHFGMSPADFRSGRHQAVVNPEK